MKFTDDRIPLDSEHAHGCCADFRLAAMKQFAGTECPHPDEVYNFIEGFDESDFVAIEFYVMLPFLVDVLESDPIKYRQSIANFCHKLTKDVDMNHPARNQLERQQRRIGGMLLRALPEPENSNENDQLDFFLIIAGIAATYGEPDIGVEIYRIHDRLNDND